MKMKFDARVYLTVADVCCPSMEKRIKNDDIVFFRDNMYVRGHPCFVDDGGDRWDDMTAEYPISYCPFCGKYLAPVASDRWEKASNALEEKDNSSMRSLLHIEGGRNEV